MQSTFTTLFTLSWHTLTKHCFCSSDGRHVHTCVPWRPLVGSPPYRTLRTLSRPSTPGACAAPAHHRDGPYYSRLCSSASWPVARQQLGPSLQTETIPHKSLITNISCNWLWLLVLKKFHSNLARLTDLILTSSCFFVVFSAWWADLWTVILTILIKIVWFLGTQR